MSRKKKLKVGDLVLAYFLGTSDRCEVIEITEKNSYKLRMPTGTILPGVKWKKDYEKKTPWYIDAYLGHSDVTKSKEDQNTSQNTTDKLELKTAIKKQKDFISGKIKK
jgi:hypothetical protein